MVFPQQGWRSLARSEGGTQSTKYPTLAHFGVPIKGALDKFNIITKLFHKKLGFFIPLEVLA